MAATAKIINLIFKYTQKAGKD